MIVEPRIRGFICTTAHPVGCAAHVDEMIAVARRQTFSGPGRALIIGSSTGYGLASRIALAMGGGSDTLGIMYEKPADSRRTASAGFYNTRAFEKRAREAGRYAETINGDAFSLEVKEEAVRRIRADLGQVDLIIYSLAAPRRVMPDGEQVRSVIKPVGEAYESISLNLQTNRIEEIGLEPADAEEIRQTVAVMGGSDWSEWIYHLLEAGVLAEGWVTLAYSYIGPEVTYPIYRDGTIGLAKQDLYRTAAELRHEAEAGEPPPGSAWVSVNKAVVTQSSAAIPSVALYLAALYREMKARGTHEGYQEQMSRLFAERLYSGAGRPDPPLDREGRIRVDELEMDPAVQAAVRSAWSEVTNDNLDSLLDLEGYWDDFYQLFGFRITGVDYGADVDIEMWND